MKKYDEQEGKKEQALLKILRGLVVERLDMTKELTDEELYVSIDDVLMLPEYRGQFSVRLRMQYRQALYDSFRRLDVLSEALDDPEVTEIMVNGYNQIYVEKHGELMHFAKTFSSQEKLEDVIQQIVAKVNRRVNEANPMADARLEDGSRVNIILPPIALNGPILTIRRFESVIKMGSIVKGSSAVSCKPCAGTLQHFYLRRNWIRKNDISGSIGAVYSRERAYRHDRGFGGAALVSYSKLSSS